MSMLAFYTRISVAARPLILSAGLQYILLQPCMLGRMKFTTLQHGNEVFKTGFGAHLLSKDSLD